MPRYKLTIEYDGAPFAGWQRQDNAPSVQEELEKAAQKLDQSTVTVQGAGRTDSGVHALGQVAHIDLTKDLAEDKVRDALNYHLKPNPVAVLEAERVSDEFHARFSATQRHYLYRIIDRRVPLTLDRGQVWRVPRALDASAMHKAAQFLVGTHDFTTFRDAQCQAESPVKSIDKVAVARYGEEVQLTIEARSFLHRQVRSITGSLVEVGFGKWSPQDFKAALDAADRSRCGPVAPPDGLYLTAVDYPADAGTSA
ncbi:MAG: tRNA pseudouridine(38-40) synthase TruA [Maricaulis sp.]|jgi:tRNA pseudouridine38-40 synthase|uniref:tRNA pseudouridine(38-40) synthase TruA n=1 Tax=Maricaulis sp. TaxID=1486257 RepID=UPI001B04D050|nr:tRNA pseudouridine(38-40) synthase TruA [Maricaulis sp.]MBO6730902.1 tRNA pseudouridine(38-40) synthase TruA [Maricaulis sp.]MBO6846863.1 tRNA pseudouridine(38-40) synthase TruA [Maricaulis sp.]MBO6877619.1 tRNA pseudouridine(38-40) synthase TruA [Maricaulis sp.]